MKEKINQLNLLINNLKKNFNIDDYKECIIVAVELIELKVADLDFKFDDLESLLRAAVMAQVIYDDKNWLHYINYFPNKSEQYSFLNTIQILEKNIND